MATMQQSGSSARPWLTDGLPEEEFDRVTRMATALTGAPVSLFSIPFSERQVFKSLVGLGGKAGRDRQTPLSQSFCRHVVARDAPLVLEDARTHPDHHDNDAIVELGVVAYAGFPVHDADGAVLGALCAIDDVPRAWTEAQLRSLEDLAAMATAEIALRSALAEREAALELLAGAARLLHEQLAEAERREAGLRVDRGQQVHALSHEMRTPLYSIRGLAEIILKFERSAPLALQADLAVIDASAKEALDVIDREIAAAREATGAAAGPDDIDLGTVLDGVRTMMAPLCAADDVVLLVHAPEGARRLPGDEIRLAQILRNLVTASLASGCERIEVRASASASGLTLEVSGGTSVGDARLALVDRLARSLGGRLDAPLDGPMTVVLARPAAVAA